MKYIIDIPSEFLLKDDGYSFSDGNSYCITGNLSKLTPYIEPVRKAIEDRVWEFIRTCLAMDAFDFVDAFDSCSYINLLKYSYQEAKAKYEAWLKQKDDIHKDEIHVGDEVIAKANMKDALGNFYEPFVITGMLSCMVVGFGKKYKYHSMGINDVVKTGRHFDEVEVLLKKIGSEE